MIAFIFVANKSVFLWVACTKEKSREDFRLLSWGSISGQKHDPGYSPTCRLGLLFWIGWISFRPIARGPSRLYFTYLLLIYILFWNNSFKKIFLDLQFFYKKIKINHFNLNVFALYWSDVILLVSYNSLVLVAQAVLLLQISY